MHWKNSDKVRMWMLCRLLYRSHTEYDEAIKCYKNALRMEPESIQVLRDLAGLQARQLLLSLTI